ncbi:hypothetical protein IQ22_00678 [Pseudomonas duriflava]|uniref:Uncharacterized protein n=1 Tax=Pseudomonas duriflava TaxID=459528 RepID=A0A562QL25_9PSED|nr:hypothetical protein [Pseudomonas duriflava]TWI57462.1 hypothetical protein IQ22_00678 [Pseudomonas duriflava]
MKKKRTLWQDAAKFRQGWWTPVKDQGYALCMKLSTDRQLWLDQLYVACMGISRGWGCYLVTYIFLLALGLPQHNTTHTLAGGLTLFLIGFNPYRVFWRNVFVDRPRHQTLQPAKPDMNATLPS